METEKEVLASQTKKFEPIRPLALKFITVFFILLAIGVVLDGIISIVLGTLTVTGIMLVVLGGLLIPISLLIYFGIKSSRIVGTVLLSTILITIWIDFGLLPDINRLTSPIFATSIFIVLLFYIWLDRDIQEYFMIS